MSANPLRTLQDAHAPECMCVECIKHDAPFLPDPISCDDEDELDDSYDYEPDEYELEADAADTRNDWERS